MRIEFVRSGGFAGVRLAATIDTTRLSPGQADDLEKLIQNAGFFDLPEKVTGDAKARDLYQYRITVTSTRGAHSVLASEDAVPDRLRPLLNYLTTLATSKQSS